MTVEDDTARRAKLKLVAASVIALLFMIGEVLGECPYVFRLDCRMRGEKHIIAGNFGKHLIWQNGPKLYW